MQTAQNMAPKKLLGKAWEGHMGSGCRHSYRQHSVQTDDPKHSRKVVLQRPNTATMVYSLLVTCTNGPMGFLPASTNGVLTNMHQWGSYQHAPMGFLLTCTNGVLTDMHQWGSYQHAPMGFLLTCTNGVLTDMHQWGSY